LSIGDLILIGLLCAAITGAAFAEIKFRDWSDPDEVKWEEGKFSLPVAPKDANLIEFYVSPIATSKFYIDRTTISPGKEDGVVRYVMVVKTAGGSTNVSFEGLRCVDLHMRLYATGRPDGTWVESPNKSWKPVKNLTLNLHQGALARNYFCPNYVPVFTVEEALEALRRGRHKDVAGEA
jgi:hypothetical protein